MKKWKLAVFIAVLTFIECGAIYSEATSTESRAGISFTFYD